MCLAHGLCIDTAPADHQQLADGVDGGTDRRARIVTEGHESERQARGASLQRAQDPWIAAGNDDSLRTAGPHQRGENTRCDILRGNVVNRLDLDIQRHTIGQQRQRFVEQQQRLVWRIAETLPYQIARPLPMRW